MCSPSRFPSRCDSSTSEGRKPASVLPAPVGATSSVGEALVELLEERDFPVKDLHLLASNESAGQSLSFRGRQVRVRSLDAFDFTQVQLAFFAAGSEVTRTHQERVVAAGCSVIDLSAAFSLDQAPCVLPELGAEGLPALTKPWCVSAPTPSAVACALVLATLFLKQKEILYPLAACCVWTT